MISKEVMDKSKQMVIESGEKINSEQQQRQLVMKRAKLMGCEAEARQIMDRTDKMMRECGNPEERQQIAIMGISELNKLGLLNPDGALNVNGIQLIPGKN